MGGNRERAAPGGDNVMMSDEGNVLVRVIDFGLAKVVGPPPARGHFQSSTFQSSDIFLASWQLVFLGPEIIQLPSPDTSFFFGPMIS